MTEKSNILSNLIKNQRDDISLEKKLSFKDLNRISYNLNSNIFSDECSIWNGYITNINLKKNYYISFFYKNKKVSLHRLLFANYIEDINDNEYIKYSCLNKGKCCTLNHMKKILKEDDIEINNNEINNNEINDIEINNNEINNNEINNNDKGKKNRVFF